MSEQTFHLSLPGGEMEVFAARPDDSSARPLVLMYMDMWGIREVLRGLARRVASLVYCCLLPDFYYRAGRVRYSDAEDGGVGKSFADLGSERQALLQQAMANLSDAMVIEDTQALLVHVDSTGWALPGAAGAIGYCMGGRHVLCVAAAFAERIRVAACIHGAYLTNGKPDSPHLRARAARGEIYFGHAELDKYAPPAVLETLEAALRDAQPRVQAVVHRGAQHGYAIPDRDVYHRGAAELDWENIRAMLGRQLSR